MKLLLVNGNRTQAVTDTALAEARRVAAPDTEVVGVTARFGADIVSTRADNAIAIHAVLDALARHYRGFDAALLAISLDSGLGAARQLLPIPVVGMTEAALLTACMLGDRFGMITFGRQARSMYLDLVDVYGVTRRLATCRTIDTVSAADYLNADVMAGQIVAEATRLVSEADVDAVVICGAALAGMARRLQPSVPVPLVDGIACGVRQAELLVRSGFPSQARDPAARGREMKGVAQELAELFRGWAAEKPSHPA